MAATTERTGTQEDPRLIWSIETRYGRDGKWRRVDGYISETYADACSVIAGRPRKDGLQTRLVERCGP